MSELDSDRRLLRARGFHDLLDRVWEPVPGEAGTGRLRAGADSTAPDLIDRIVTGGRSSDAAAVLLGILCEAESTPSGEEHGVRRQVRAALARIASAAESLAEGDDATLWAIAYLLAHFPDARAEILPRLTARFGDEHKLVAMISGVFDLAGARPEQAHSIVTYLGAESCARVGADRRSILRDTLACPECGVGLELGEAAIECLGCGALFEWRGNVMDLVPEGSGQEDEFPPELVARYESGSRPWFVKLMAGDWNHATTPEREAEYIRGFVRPLDGPILDVACGAGGWTRRLAEVTGTSRLIALDYSVPMIEACHEAVPDAVHIRGDATRLPIANDSLGGAHCWDALQALPDADAGLREIARCLKPGARLTAFTFRDAGGAYGYLQERIRAVPRRLFSDAWVRSTAAELGMKVVDISGPEHALFFTLENAE